MKRRALITLLAMSMTATMITGCGSKPSQSLAAETSQETTVESSEESSVETSEEADPATDTEEAEPSTEEASDGTDQITGEEPGSEPAQEASRETEETNKETSKESGTGAESSSVAPDEATASESPASAEVETPTSEEQPQEADYTVTEMSATMYVQNSVNLRQGPGTSYSKVGSLKKGDQVTVTGQADNGWYRLDSGAFVSNNYLGNTAPSAAAANTPSASVDQTGEVIPVETPVAAVSTGADFLNYLNQQRSAAGLGTLSWDSNMAAVAQRRAQEITNGLNHSGNVEQYGEVIQLAVTGTATEWYTNWYNSEAHRASMMSANYTRAGVGVYNIGNNYYVVCNFEGDPISAEEQLEQLKPENLVPAGGNESGTVNSFSTTGETLDPNNPDDAEIIKKIEEQDHLIDEGLLDVPELKETDDGYFIIP